ncbi:hypothetical protein [Paracoccus sp. SY]|uniref:hypothetical protein n=1 Tax=Paracoccus sp. SY TaxID=1330255 RepID=UPI000CD0FA21|nr:hypothetical protein [Paracoccus sp. SY]
MTKKIDPDLTLSAAEIATMTGRTVRWVQSMAKDGYFSKDGRGRYRLESVIQGLLRHEEDQAAKGNQAAAASRATDARTREIDQRMAIRDRQLIPIEDAIMALDTVCGVVNTQLTGLPARISRDLGIRRKVETEIHRVRQAISDALAEMSRASKTGVGLDDGGAHG